MDKESIAVLIPAHNEARTIGKLVDNILEIVDYVCVVDDGSNDNTGNIAKQHGAIVITHPVCKGKGAALKTGFQHFQNLPYDVIIAMDGDGQHPVSDLHVFIEAIKKNKKAGIIVGKRKIIGSDMPPIRRLTNLSMSILISILAFQWIPDSQNGFRAIRKKVVENMLIITNHFETETEILLRACWKGVKISSVPVSTIYQSEKSKIKPIRDTIKFFLMLLKICVYHGRKTRL
ncbi:MAG TPA: glycosyltransferase family 2 protein [bacterium]|nr:glycosyltransferase family 2 protein [bacterium]HOL49297.1 glycosyltransferase family 2 protein [bacterium]HPO51384.1 glycosyltransferase family 2 protein [bacterium]HXK44431.1 glycosyltransferase family 2 protein [bacterium]